MRTISSLPPELTRLLFNAGTRAIVLVEGDDDCYVLREWFSDRLSEVEFYDCGGIINLNKWLEALLNLGSLKRAYAITDRDFRGEAEVNDSYAEGSHSFILRRYALENYLLEPKPLWELMKLWDKQITDAMPDEQTMANRLLEHCRSLRSVMAANWVFYETNLALYRSAGVTARLEYFSTGHETDRQIVIQRATKRLQCDEAEAELQIAEKEQEVDRYLTDLSNAHQVIDGKRILHRINQEFFKTDVGRLFRFLTDKAKSHGLPADVVHIVRDRILISATRRNAP
jgi:hypothetical protein